MRNPFRSACIGHFLSHWAVFWPLRLPASGGRRELSLTGRIKIDTVSYEPRRQAAARAVLPIRLGALARAPVVKSLDTADRRIIGEDIKDVEYSWPIGMPLVRSLGRGLWEVRSSLPHGRIARALFCAEPDCVLPLHGFMKKRQKTPKRDIELAHERKKGDAG